MVDVICDSDFLIHLTTKRIQNIDSINLEIGSIQFVVPTVVIKELERLSKIQSKKSQALAALSFSKKLRRISTDGEYADKSILTFIKKHGGIVATLDKRLKNQIKDIGNPIITISNDKIILES